MRKDIKRSHIVIKGERNMGYKMITVHAGHNAFVPGATGCGYKEHEVAREFAAMLIDAFKQAGQAVACTTDDMGKTQNENLANIVRNCNSYDKDGRLDISLHLNAAASMATGVEVLYYDQQALSASVSRAISEAVGIRDRGAKERKELRVLNSTNAPALLIELAFITNPDDMRKLLNNKHNVISSIVKTLTGREAPVSSGTKKIVISGLSAAAIHELSQMFLEKRFWAQIQFLNNGTSYAVTGALSGENLACAETWFQEHGWSYELRDA
ncbi:N-acetylmuramoyl-L-alanine amidase [Paenibacillus thiaminolyticus]|uniref:N-acetylmuramoyl-L-alanine amidase n=1 Tax=Paenibacillus thiaminolyticus TaxID=49283 RepID=UPI003D2C619F